MQTIQTKEQVAAIVAAIDKIGLRPFQQESGDPKTDAQRNLCGRTHYVDDDTLRWHKSRVISTARIADGLLFRVTTSDALDMDNTRRGFRCAVFDAFGTCVWRPELEASSKTSDKARDVAGAIEFDAVAHYRKEIAELVERKNKEAADLQSALAAIA